MIYLTGQCVFSECRTYRYSLWRPADPFGEGFCLFIGLNPSTADETKNDPTIRRCIRFARDWGYRELCMANLFAFRATDPSDMRLAPDPIGPDNNTALAALTANADVIVAAWGTEGSYRGRAAWALASLPPMKCLGFTKDGLPRHPLYVRADQRLIPCESEAEKP